MEALTYRVYESTLSRANNATCGTPVAHKPLLLVRDNFQLSITPTYIEQLEEGRLRVVHSQITLFLEPIAND